MVARIYIYSHLAAVALTGLASYWDRVGFPTNPVRYLSALGLMSVYLLPVFPLVSLFIVCSRKTKRKEKISVGLVGLLATVAQIIAAIPLIQ
jgi:uncharacterized membrane protein